jgi:hypothetical protein
MCTFVNKENVIMSALSVTLRLALSFVPIVSLLKSSITFIYIYIYMRPVHILFSLKISDLRLIFFTSYINSIVIFMQM